MVLSQIVFHKQLPEPTVKGLEKEHMPKKDKKRKKSSWFSWGRSAENEADLEKGMTSDLSEVTALTSSASTTTLTDANSLQKDATGMPDLHV